MSKSPVVILYDADGKPLAVQDGVAIPANTPALLVAGKEPVSGNAKYLRVATDGTIRVDPTGTTTQPISATSLPLPTDAATATKQTDGTQKSVVRGGAKGTTTAADVTSVSVDTNIQALHVKIIGGGSSVVDSNVNIVDPSGNNIATADGSAPATNRGLMVEGYDQTGVQAHRLAVDSLGRLIIASSGTVSSQAGFAFGDVNLTVVTTVLVNRTAYTEQTTNAQRSIASASAADTNTAGTGARQVRITYLDQTGAGPYTETVNLNGTTYVNTTAVNICFIEKMEIVSVGSGGSNAGIITLKAAITGGGATIGTIAVSNNQTFWTHHYVPISKTCYITSISCSSNSSTVGNGSLYHLRAYRIGLSTNPNTQISDFVWVHGQSSNVVRNYGTPIRVIGPARITGWVTTIGSSNIVYRTAFDYYDQ